jgi:catechol 2,3-dioxygenase-like lactoylglutathione lyase family enzyme
LSSTLTSVGAITLFVQDPKRSKAFYENAFGDPPVWEDANSCVFSFNGVLINLLADGEAPKLIEPAPVASRNAGSRLMFSIWVDDAHATSAALAERGVELLNGPIDRPWGKRTAAFADPDGHVWEIAQDI